MNYKRMWVMMSAVSVLVVGMLFFVTSVFGQLAILPQRFVWQEDEKFEYARQIGILNPNSQHQFFFERIPSTATIPSDVKMPVNVVTVTLQTDGGLLPLPAPHAVIDTDLVLRSAVYPGRSSADWWAVYGNAAEANQLVIDARTNLSVTNELHLVNTDLSVRGSLTANGVRLEGSASNRPEFNVTEGGVVDINFVALHLDSNVNGCVVDSILDVPDPLNDVGAILVQDWLNARVDELLACEFPNGTATPTATAIVSPMPTVTATPTPVIPAPGNLQDWVYTRELTFTVGSSVTLDLGDAPDTDGDYRYVGGLEPRTCHSPFEPPPPAQDAEGWQLEIGNDNFSFVPPFDGATLELQYWTWNTDPDKADPIVTLPGCVHVLKLIAKTDITEDNSIYLPLIQR